MNLLMIVFMFQTNYQNNFYQIFIFILLYQSLKSSSFYLTDIAGKCTVTRILTLP